MKLDKLDKLDKQILAQLDLNARIPLTQLARKLNVSQETVNFRMHRLQNKKILKSFYTIINTSKVGWFYYKTFFALHKILPLQEQELLDFLSSSPHCAYVARIEGTYSIIVLHMVEQAIQLRDFLNSLYIKYGQFIQEKEIHTVMRTHRFNQKVFLPMPTNHISYDYHLEKHKLKKIELDVLHILSSQARKPLTTIAQELNLDVKVIQYHFKKLQQDKIILGYGTSIDFEKLGYEFIQLNLSLVDTTKISSILTFFDKTNHCMFALELLGKYDLTIELWLENDAQLRLILNSFKEKFINIFKKIDISRIYSEEKIVWAPI